MSNLQHQRIGELCQELRLGALPSLYGSIAQSAAKRTDGKVGSLFLRRWSRISMVSANSRPATSRPRCRQLCGASPQSKEMRMKAAGAALSGCHLWRN